MPRPHLASPTGPDPRQGPPFWALEKLIAEGHDLQSALAHLEGYEHHATAPEVFHVLSRPVPAATSSSHRAFRQAG